MVLTRAQSKALEEHRNDSGDSDSVPTVAATRINTTGAITVQLKTNTQRDKGAAARQVANTYELVEQILLRLRDLSPKDAVNAEIISKTFQHVLQRSLNLRPRLELPEKGELSKNKENEQNVDAEVYHNFQPKPDIFTLLQSTRRHPSPSEPELSVTATIPHFQMADEKWRGAGCWRSWLLLRSTTRYIQSVHVRGNGPWALSRRSRRGWWSVNLSYRSQTGIILGDLVDMAYELKDLTGGPVALEIDLAVDEHGVAKRHGWYQWDFVDSEEEDAVDGQVPVEFPDYHETMRAAAVLKALGKHMEHGWSGQC